MKNVEAICPLSPLQEVMLVQSQLSSEGDVYFRQLVCRLEGPLNRRAFAETWQRIVARHGILRTAFLSKGLDRPLQVIRRELEFPLVEEDWRGRSAAEQEEALGAYRREDRKKGLDLTRAPLLRVALFRLSEDASWLVMSFHHLLLDGWSKRLLFQEILQIYGARCRDLEPELSPAHPFAEYIHWLEEQDGARAETFWRQELAGFEPPTPLEIGRSATAMPGGLMPVERRWGAAESDAVRELARRAQVTLYTVIQAAWGLLLSRYSDRRDSLFGSVVSTLPEDLPGIESMLGVFINILPVRMAASPQDALVPWLEDLQERDLERRRHGYLPLARVQTLAGLSGGERLFESLVIFEHTPVGDAVLQGADGLKIVTESYDFDLEATDYPLGLTVEPGRELTLRVVAESGRFDLAARSRMLRHFEQLLRGMVSAEIQRLEELTLLTPGERHQLSTEWNDTRADYPRAKGVHHLFTRAVAATPDAVAVESGEQVWTYRELDVYASNLARRLRDLGVGPEVCVGVCLERSPMLLAALLAVWKAGGAYVPLDPAYPKERTAYILDHVQAEVVLAEKHLMPLLEDVGGEHLILGEDGWQPQAEPLGGWEGLSGDLAYVMYTSGSTGRPKGVQIAHGSVANFLTSMGRKLGMTSADRLLAVTTVSFDISVLEMFLPLSLGARVVVVDREEAADGERLLQRLEKTSATVMQATPVTWHLLLAGGWQGAPPAVVLCGGEALSPELARELAARGSAWNLFGPTETTIWSTAEQLPEAGGAVSIGRPIANTQIHILSADLRPMPWGLSGELFIAGHGLARGYFARPEETAWRFLPDPFAEEEGERLYRTGDLARWGKDGRLEFLGRRDHQVKLRGFRIELGEIEAVLEQHPEVARAAALIISPGEAPMLAAWVVPGAEGVSDFRELKDFAAQRLPHYMVPDHLAELAELPKTPNGKLDRRALAALPLPTDLGRSRYTAPRTPFEQMLAEVWTEVLGVERVGAHDHFFELGGHSLLAAQLVARVHRVCGVEMPLRTVFDAPGLEAQAARLEALLGAGQEREEVVLEPVPRSRALPLSFAQQRLWFLDQLQPGSAFYNIAMAQRLHGHLRLSAMVAAFEELVRRHEVLRTVFEVRRGEPFPKILPPAPVTLPQVDLTGLDSRRRQEVAQQWMSVHSRRPFDLARGPLWRALLLTLEDEEQVLVVSLHHIVGDGWSNLLLVREIGALYGAFAAGRPSPLPELPVQYVDYAHWQRRWLSGQVLESQLKYWRECLEGSPSFLELPTDRPRPALQTFHGARRQFTVGATTWADLGAFCRRHGVTRFMVLLTVLNTLLARISGRGDLLIGSPIANRTRVEIEGLIGFFMNTLVLRTVRRGDPTFRELLDQVRDKVLGAYGHRDLPFELLVDELGVERVMSHTPLFQVLLTLQNVPLDTVELDELTLSPVEAPTRTAKFDLTWALAEAPSGTIPGTLDYNTDLFDASTVERWIGSFKRLLSAALRGPEQSLSHLPMLSPAAVHQVVVGWNEVADPEIGEFDLLDHLETWVKRDPGRPAVIFGEECRSYGELFEEAGLLAGHLRQLGVGQPGNGETRVGICLEQGLDRMTAVLGVLGAGGICVPLDPTYPEERLAFLLEDTAAPILLTQKNLVERVQGGGAQCLIANKGWRGVAADSPGFPPRKKMLERIFYVLYTSGSTGRPKGVELPWEAFTHLMAWRLEGLWPEMRSLQFASLSFDVSFYEMFAAWLSGGTLYLVPEGMRRDVPTLARYLLEQGIESAILPVVVLHQLAETFRAEDCWPQELREVISTGEQLQVTPAMVEWFERQPSCELRNYYGPSESHVVTGHTLSGAAATWPFHPPIGRPISGSRILLLDPYLEPVPPGVEGELYIGGRCLARGYLGRPALTAEKFRPDPSNQESGARLYATGDLARSLADGTLVYLGRLDHQIKIRGFRVEPGEIEAVLVEHPAVREAVVMAHRAPTGGLQLVAYVVAAGTGTGREDLRSFLRGKLPEYLVPVLYRFLDAMPLNANGKVDRRALPEPEIDRGVAGKALPNTAAEELIAGIWEQCLGIEAVGVEENFFELGGHSLLATQVMARITEAFRVELPLRTLFEEPTVGGLGVAVETALKGGDVAAAPPVVPVPRDQELPLSFAQHRLWFLDQLEPESASYNLFSGVRLLGKLDLEALHRAFAEIVRRHEILRTRIVASDGRPHQVVEEAMPPDLPLYDLSELPQGERDEALKRRLALASGQPFRLEEGHLLRLGLVRLGEEEHVLLLTVHHIVADAWSMQILVRELVVLYGAYAVGRPSPLPEPGVQYADFASWQVSWLEGEVLEGHLEYWRRQLRGMKPLHLPGDGPQEAMGQEGARHDFEIGESLLGSLQTLSQEAGVTLFMTLLAAFQVLLNRYTEQEDIVLGADIANRNRRETEGLIGFFINMLVLRTDLSENPTFHGLLERVREVTLGAYAHQDLPFEKLVEELQPERSSSHSPLFHVVFNFDNTAPLEGAMGGDSVEGLRLEMLKLDHIHVRFELALLMRPEGRRLQCRWLYDPKLFSPQRIAAMERHLVHLLGECTARPEARIRSLDHLSAREREEHQATTRKREDKKQKKLLKLKRARPEPVQL